MSNEQAAPLSVLFVCVETADPKPTSEDGCRAVRDDIEGPVLAILGSLRANA